MKYDRNYSGLDVLIWTIDEDIFIWKKRVSKQEYDIPTWTENNTVYIRHKARHIIT